uniref:uncharacterized protein K02A2.6-like n=1 Tax=Erigeron canadensis TaxID=72917 RepID=UPI001CB9D009|nr:uncharacterized protein K02A2.6-like [Erigeron canadensis]
MLIGPDQKEYTYALRFKFETTNNEAEYEALLAGLRIAKDMKVRHIHVYVDSQLVAKQVQGEFEAKQSTIKKYLEKVHELINCFGSFEIEHIRRNQNQKADALSKLASLTFSHLAKDVLIEVLEDRSIEGKEVLATITEDLNNWITPIKEYLVSGLLLEDKNEARKIRIKAPQFKLMDGVLYKKASLTPWLRCVGPNEANMIITETHGGICGHHAGPRSIVAKILRLGYYWPTMHQDASATIQVCVNFQLHANVSRMPKQDMTSVISAWPFAQWRIDIVGPLPAALSGHRFLIVAIDYFTKWVEAKPLTEITGKNVEKFIFEHIICRFGVPHTIISDNGKQFLEGTFPDFCGWLKLQQNCTFVYHP